MVEIPQALETGAPSPDDHENITTRIYQERERIKFMFAQQFLFQENEAVLKRFFQIHEQGIVDLIDRIFAFKKRREKNNSGNGLLEAFQNTLNQLLDVLEIKYTLRPLSHI